MFLLVYYGKVLNYTGSWSGNSFNLQAQVVQTLDSAIQWTNHYPVDK